MKKLLKYWLVKKKAEESKKIHFQAATKAALSGRPWQNADHAAFVAGLTALFSAYWWGAEMG